VKALVAAPLETKYVSNPLKVNSVTVLTDLSAWTGFSPDITGTGEIYPCIPKTVQGTADHNRIGDRLNPVKIKVSLDIAPIGYADTDSFDRTVYIYLLQSLSVKSLDNYTAIPITLLLDNGAGSSVKFDGTPYTAQYPVNTKEFRVLKVKQVRLTKGIGQITGGDGDPVGIVTPSRSYAKVRMTVKAPKTIKYEGSSTKYPTNFAPFLVMGWHDNIARDGVSGVLTGVQAIGQVEMYYKDG